MRRVVLSSSSRGHVGHVLEMHMADLVRLEQIQSPSQLVVARPEVVRVHQRLDRGMSAARVTFSIVVSVEMNGDARVNSAVIRIPGKLLHDVAGLPHVVRADLVVVLGELLHPAADRRVDVRQPQFREHLAALLQVVERAAWFAPGSSQPADAASR